jgi:polyadenylate-binding protein
MRYDDLAGLSPVVRKEVLTGELCRRVKSMDIIPHAEVDVVVELLVALSLSEVMAGIEDPAKLKDQVHILRKSLKPPDHPSRSKSPSPAASQVSSFLDPNANATASAPEHPSTPISVSASLSTPPRTSSPSGSVPPASERERMMASISKFESARQSELTDLLMSLPKRERAMCLFNVEVLRAKLADAKMVLDSDEADEEAQKTAVPSDVEPAISTSQAPVTPQAKKTAPRIEDSPKTPDLSSKGPSAASSPVPGTPGNAPATHTVASLAKLPASEIIRIVSSATPTGLPLPKADTLVMQATDEFIDGLMNKQPQVQKQQLGDKL